MFKILFYLTIFFSHFALANQAAAEQEHKHHHGDVSSLELNNGEKWEIDESLHVGMTKIKTLMAKDLNAIHHNTFSHQGYQVLAEAINGQIKYLFAHCNLPAKADVELHKLLARVVMASEQMNAGTASRKGAVQVIGALNDYPRYFNDPQWVALKH